MAVRGRRGNGAAVTVTASGCVSVIRAPAWRRMVWMRCSGWLALIGRKVRPVSSTASAATICSTPFSITMATSRSAGSSTACN